MITDITPILEFLKAATPRAWIDAAVDNLDILLIDHAQCEKKAASTALMLIHRHPDREELLYKLSRLAREELRHFEQVLDILKSRGGPLSPCGAVVSDPARVPKTVEYNFWRHRIAIRALGCFGFFPDSLCRGQISNNSNHDSASCRNPRELSFAVRPMSGSSRHSRDASRIALAVSHPTAA